MPNLSYLRQLRAKLEDSVPLDKSIYAPVHIEVSGNSVAEQTLPAELRPRPEVPVNGMNANDQQFCVLREDDLDAIGADQLSSYQSRFTQMIRSRIGQSTSPFCDQQHVKPSQYEAKVPATICAVSESLGDHDDFLCTNFVLGS